MKKIILTAAIAAALFLTTDVMAQQGFGTNTPDKSAAVHIESSKRGLLIPQIALVDTDSKVPIAAEPANSLLVFNTATTGGTKGVTPGFYFWTKTGSTTGHWQRIKASDDKVDPKNIQGGTNRQVLVTKETAPGSGIFEPTWVDRNTVIDAGNGLEYDALTQKLGLGGTLEKATTIITSGANTLAITGLGNVGTAFDADAQNLVIMGADGVLKVVSSKEVVKKAIDAKDLTTDGKIVIGNNTSTNTSLTGAVLQTTQLSIKQGSIGTTEITAPGSTTADPTTGTAGKVMVTDAAGKVAWIDQSALPSNTSITAGTNTTVTGNGSTATPFNINVATANGTTLGVVQEATTTPTINIAAGVLSINKTNTTLLGDVTGPLNATVVEKIRGVNVATTAPTANQVLTYNAGTTSWTPTDAGTLVTAKNGVRVDATDANAIKLGGPLTDAATTITTTSTNTLAIAGLQTATAANQAVVVEAGGTLRTIEKTLQGTDVNVATNSGYSPYIPEVVLNITLADTDQTITFPTASTAPGQVINIKIANTDDDHKGYLNVLDTYGAMPYQGWIVKSNGTNWVIVGRN